VAYRAIRAAAQFGVAISTALINWVRRFRETGKRRTGPSRRLLGRRKIAGPHRDWAVANGGRKADFTLRGLVAELAGLKVDYRTVWEFVHAEKLSHKKKTLIAAEQNRPDVARRRAQWTKYRERIDPSRPGVQLTRPGQKPTWQPLRGWGAARPADQKPWCHMVIGRP